MPELPEVETVRRGLIPRMVGHRIVRLTQRRKDLRVALPDALRPTDRVADRHRHRPSARNTC
jgi:formamidopyrimidine-DNA glycosylase